MVDGGTAAQHEVLGRKVSDQLAVPVVLHVGARGHLTDEGAVNVPLIKNGLNFGLAALVDDDEHALLRLRKQDFPRVHTGLTGRNPVEVDRHADVSARTHFGGRAGNARGTHVLHAHHGSGIGEFHRRLEEQLLLKGVTHLYRRDVVGRVLAQIFRGKGCAVNAVAPG